MSIIVKRDTGAIGFLGKEKIFIDGEHVESVANNQQVEIELPNGTGVFSMNKHVKNSQRNVQDGDIVTITGNPLTLILLFAFLVFFMLGSFVFNRSYLGLFCSFIALFSILANTFFVQRYNITVEKQTDEQPTTE